MQEKEHCSENMSKGKTYQFLGPFLSNTEVIRAFKAECDGTEEYYSQNSNGYWRADVAPPSENKVTYIKVTLIWFFLKICHFQMQGKCNAHSGILKNCLNLAGVLSEFFLKNQSSICETYDIQIRDRVFGSTDLGNELHSCFKLSWRRDSIMISIPTKLRQISITKWRGVLGLHVSLHLQCVN